LTFSRVSVAEGSVFTEPLPSKWTSASGFQAVFTEALSSNGHIRHNIMNSEALGTSTYGMKILLKNGRLMML
jgi:hypothetical protein